MPTNGRYRCLRHKGPIFPTDRQGNCETPRYIFDRSHAQCVETRGSTSENRGSRAAILLVSYSYATPQTPCIESVINRRSIADGETDKSERRCTSGAGIIRTSACSSGQRREIMVGRMKFRLKFAKARGAALVKTIRGLLVAGSTANSRPSPNVSV